MEEQLWMTGLLSLAAGCDLLERRVPNVVVIFGTGAGVLFSVCRSGGEGIFRSVAGILLGFICLFWLYVIRGIGAGDVKIFSMIGSYGNWKVLFLCIVCSFLAGAVMALGKMLLQRDFLQRFQHLFSYARGCICSVGGRQQIQCYQSISQDRKRDSICMCVAILAGYVMSIYLM